MKQELANLAITLNMEAQKRRHLEMDQSRQNTKTERKDIQVSRKVLGSDTYSVMQNVPF